MVCGTAERVPVGTAVLAVQWGASHAAHRIAPRETECRRCLKWADRTKVALCNPCSSSYQAAVPPQNL